MNCRSLRTLILALGLTAPRMAFAQTAAERLWMAGRYDRNHVVMYFSAVKFNGTVPPDAAKIAEPKADAFFYPVGLPAVYVSQLQKKTPRAERFSVGDRYDLLLDGGRLATITLDQLVGFENDEQVGNDSYLGALGRVAPRVGLAAGSGRSANTPMYAGWPSCGRCQIFSALNGPRSLMAVPYW